MPRRRAAVAWIAALAVAAASPYAIAQTLPAAHREPYRDPMGAAGRSLVFPGWGQHYNGQSNKGYVFTAGVATGALFAFELLQLASSDRHRAFERGAGLAFMGLVWGWSVVDAYATAPKVNLENGYDIGGEQAGARGRGPRGARDPAATAILTATVTLHRLPP